MTPPEEATRRAALAHVVSGMLAYRGHGSPEALERSYPRGESPYSGATVRRIIDGADDKLYELKLMRVAGMLRLPPRALVLAYACDTAALERLDWKGETDIRQFVVEAVEEIASPPRNRRAGD